MHPFMQPTPQSRNTRRSEFRQNGCEILTSGIFVRLEHTQQCSKVLKKEERECSLSFEKTYSSELISRNIFLTSLQMPCRVLPRREPFHVLCHELRQDPAPLPF